MTNSNCSIKEGEILEVPATPTALTTLRMGYTAIMPRAPTPRGSPTCSPHTLVHSQAVQPHLVEIEECSTSLSILAPNLETQSLLLTSSIEASVETAQSEPNTSLPLLEPLISTDVPSLMLQSTIDIPTKRPA